MSPDTREPAIVVSPARRADLPAVIRLLGRAGLPADDVDETLVTGMSVARAGETLVGCAAIERLPRAGLLRSVAVDPAWRGTGLGARLVRDRIAWASSVGLEGTYLLTTTASAYFEHLGFTRIDRGDLPAEVRDTREFMDICPQTAVAMVRTACKPDDGPNARWEDR